MSTYQLVALILVVIGPALALAKATGAPPSLALFGLGLLSTAVIAADLSDLKVVCLVLAIAAGATVLSHVNDSGFWLVSRFFGMDEKTTLKTWTVMETTLGLAVFVLAALLWLVL